MIYLLLSFLKNVLLTLRYVTFKITPMNCFPFQSRRYFFIRLSARQSLHNTIPSIHVYLILLFLELYYFCHLLILRITPLSVFSVTSSCREIRRHWDTFVSNPSLYCLPVDFILLVCIFFLRRLVHELHKFVALILRLPISRKTVMGQITISEFIPARSVDSWSCHVERDLSYYSSYCISCHFVQS